MHVDGLAVDATRRRLGVARTLLRELIEVSRARGMHLLTLRVSVANRAAIALYVSEGFVVDGRLHRFYPAAAFGGEADAYAMALHL
jgi:ribosomal protein S18 acetylase RimI-like enzyme